MAHNAAGVSLTKRKVSQLRVLQKILHKGRSHKLDRSQAFFGRERVATTVQLRPPLHCQGDQRFPVSVTQSLLTQDLEEMYC